MTTLENRTSKENSAIKIGNQFVQGNITMEICEFGFFGGIEHAWCLMGFVGMWVPVCLLATFKRN